MSNTHDDHLRKIEAAYRRGYHHGLAQCIDLFGLLDHDLPAHATADLCHIFEQEVVIPWRTSDDQDHSAAPRFDLERCQRLLRAMKERQSSSHN